MIKRSLRIKVVTSFFLLIYALIYAISGTSLMEQFFATVHVYAHETDHTKSHDIEDSYIDPSLGKPCAPAFVAYQYFNLGGDVYVNCVMEESGQDGFEMMFGKEESFDTGDEIKVNSGNKKANVTLAADVDPEEYPYVRVRSFEYAQNDETNVIYSDWSNTATAEATSEDPVDYWVGDSRTVMLFQYLFPEYDEKVEGDSYPQTLIHEKCIAKDGRGFDWMQEVAYPELCKGLDKNPEARVVINMGINDCNYVSPETYITFYEGLIEEYPDAEFYFMSINPLDESYEEYKEISPCAEELNKELRKAFGEHFINTSGYLKHRGFQTTPDGIHYDRETSIKIHNFVVQYINYFGDQLRDQLD